MRSLRLAITLSFLLGLAGCGHEIGDSCALHSECSPSGDRICDTSSPGGYCTVFGCDNDTCPDDSICIRFFSVATTNLLCENNDECGDDELCTLAGTCVPRSAELRYCMKTCSDHDDCRTKYECRDEELMQEHGGEPIPEPGETLGDNLPSFCAPAPTETN
jgi:hypothetical protein